MGRYTPYEKSGDPFCKPGAKQKQEWTLEDLNILNDALLSSDAGAVKYFRTISLQTKLGRSDNAIRTMIWKLYAMEKQVGGAPYYLLGGRDKVAGSKLREGTPVWPLEAILIRKGHKFGMPIALLAQRTGRTEQEIIKLVEKKRLLP